MPAHQQNMWDTDNTTDSGTDTGDDETIAESSEKTEHSSRFGHHREQRKSPQGRITNSTTSRLVSIFIDGPKKPNADWKRAGALHDMSSATFATSFHEDSGSPLDQIQSATPVLVSILRDDEHLARLYKFARNRSRIGRATLRERIHKNIKALAEDLEGEASDDFQHAAALFVKAKAGHASRCIADQEDPYHRVWMSETQQRWANKDIEDSSEEEGADSSDDDTDSENLEAFRRFLIESEAYVTFRARVGTSCLSINAQGTVQVHPERDTLRVRVVQLLKETTAFMVVNLLVPMGCLEPPLQTGWTRFSVECHTCGERFFDDVFLDSEGDVTALTEQMQQTLSAKVTVTTSGEGQSPRGSSFQCPLWLYNTYCKVVTKLGWRKNILPVARDPQTDSAPPAPKRRMTDEETLHLMACIHRNWHSMSLLQKHVENIQNDRDLLYLLKDLVLLRRRRIARVLSCKSIQAVHFTMFELSLGDSLQVRHHEVCCTAGCECNPPASRLVGNNPEYKCTSSPKRWPQVVPAYFGHLLKHPGSVDPRLTGILDKIPKRRHGELVVDPTKAQSVEGWGLYFEEGWDAHDIMVVLVIATLASVLFLILWSVFMSDVSAASGVASYIIAVTFPLFGFVVTRAGSR